MTSLQDTLPYTNTSDPFVDPSATDEVQQHQKAAGLTVNVGNEERVASIVAGAVLALGGLKVRRLTGLAMIGAGAAMIRRGYTGNCKLNSLIGRNTAHAASAEDYFERGLHVSAAFTIEKPRAELYAFWRNFENLPSFMHHLESVKTIDSKTSRWTVKAPAGRTVSWDAEIINEQQDELIAWKSMDGADVDNAGSVRFVDAPGDRGTEVRIVVDYIPPGGKLGKWVAMLFGEAPELTIKEDLRRFKQLMEAGDVPTIEGQPQGNCSC